MKKFTLISFFLMHSVIAMELQEQHKEIEYESDMTTIETGIQNIMDYKPRGQSFAAVSFTDQLSVLTNLKLFAQEARNIDTKFKEDFSDLKKPYEQIKSTLEPKIKELRLIGLNEVLTHTKKSEPKIEKKSWLDKLKRKQNKVIITDPEDKTVPMAISNLLNKCKKQSDDWTIVLQEIQTWVEREYKKRTIEEEA